MNAVFRRNPEDQLFKFGFAFETFVFEYGHTYLLVFLDSIMLAQMGAQISNGGQSKFFIHIKIKPVFFLKIIIAEFLLPTAFTGHPGPSGDQ